MQPGLPGETSAARVEEWDQHYRDEFARDRASADLLVISAPGSGRTWHRLMLGSYLAASCGESESKALKLARLCRLAGTRRVVYSHNGVNFLDGLPAAHPAVASSSLWQDKRVLLLVRDPRDLLVSSYHHGRYRIGGFQGSISDFIRRPDTGIEKVLTAYRRWEEGRRVATSFDVVSYEEMHRDPAAVLRRTLALVGLATPDEPLIVNAVEFCRFEKMREYEAADRFGSTRLQNAFEDRRAAKVREGRIGSFATDLSEADQAFLSDALARYGYPFASAWDGR